MQVGWGVVGAGGIADRRTIPEGILTANNARLIAVTGANLEKSRSIAAKYSVKCYSSAEELYADPEIMAVYVATPNDLHCQATIGAAQAGKHVLCEKPMALDLTECDRMLATCDRHGVWLGVGFMMRFHPLHLALEEVIESGRLGRPVLGRAQLTCWYPSIANAWRQDPARSGGGALADMGSHCIDLLEMMPGKTEAVSAFVGNCAHGYPVEDAALATLKLSNGAVGVVESLWSVPDEASLNALEIYGTHGSVLASHTIGQQSTGTMTARLSGEGKVYDAQQQRGQFEATPIEVPPQNLYRAEIESFSRAILEDTEPPVSGLDGRWNLKVVLAAYESSRTGKTITLDPE